VEVTQDTIYNNLINYTPKNFSIDETSKPKNRFLELNLNSIGGLKMVYEFQNELKLSKEEILWLDKQIDQIALCFYLEGNPILIKKTGGYSGCEGEMIHKEAINGKEVTILDFCFTCSGAGKLEDFIKVFNNRTEKLLKIKMSYNSG
jgi:hypothetical protein